MLNFEWLNCRKKPIGLMLLGTIALLCIQLWGNMKDGRLYCSENGVLISIQRDSLSESLQVPLVVEAQQESGSQLYEITLSLDGENQAESDRTKTNMETTDSLKTSIEDMADELEQKEELVIMLPQKLSDGTLLTWKRPSAVTDFLILLLFPLGVGYLYRSEREQILRENKTKQEAIKRALPGFNDRILLLMNSGLIFHDAFFRIAEGYQSRKSLDAFGELVNHIVQESESSGKSIVSMMEESKKDVAMREYSRLVNIIADNQIKGVGLKEKLESESHLLWESRKAAALQKAKEIETKMTFPLAILLLVVVMITGIPAMMSM